MKRKIIRVVDSYFGWKVIVVEVSSLFLLEKKEKVPASSVSYLFIYLFLESIFLLEYLTIALKVDYCIIL